MEKAFSCQTHVLGPVHKSSLPPDLATLANQKCSPSNSPNKPAGGQIQRPWLLDSSGMREFPGLCPQRTGKDFPLLLALCLSLSTPKIKPHNRKVEGSDALLASLV